MADSRGHGRGYGGNITSSLIVVLAAALIGPPGGLAAEAEQGSLAVRYEAAERLAQTPEGRPRAIAEYRSIVEIHQANENAYQAALRRLAEHYDDESRAEDGIRLFIGVVESDERRRTETVLREVFNAFRLKHSERLKKVMAERGDTREPNPVNVPVIEAKDLAKAILQRNDKQLREKSLDRLRQMLSADSPDAAKRTALMSLHSSLSGQFDRQSFRPLVQPLLKSPDWQIRMLALECLPGLEATRGDLASLLPLVEDTHAGVRKGVAGALVAIGKGEEPSLVVPALMKLMRDPDTAVVEQSIRSMWGQYSTPEFDKFLIELSRDGRHHSSTIYHCLSTMSSKSVAVCRRLVEELDDPDWNNSGRAAWGLTYGVTDEAKPMVEAGLLRALPEETNRYTREQEFRALAKVASEKSRAYLKRVVESDMEPEAFKQHAQTILTGMDAKR